MSLSMEAPKTEALKRLTGREKAHILRSYEGFCYQITWFMLRDDKQATGAAKEVLLQIYERTDWFVLEESARLAELKYTAMKHSLEYRKRIVGAVRTEARS
jgi:hypothetical protein